MHHENTHELASLRFGMPEHKNGKKNTKMIFNEFGNISPENKDSKVSFEKFV